MSEKKDNSYGNSKYTTITEKVIISYKRKEGEYEQEYSILRRAKNQAVRNNLKKFSQGYIVELTAEESYVLRSKLLTLERKGNGSPGIRHGFSASLMHRDASGVSV